MPTETFTQNDVKIFRQALAAVKMEVISQAKAKQYLEAHPICEYCAHRNIACVIGDVKPPRVLRCLACREARLGCPRQVKFWITNISKQMRRPIHAIEALYRLYERPKSRLASSRAQPRKGTDDSDSNDNDGGALSEAESYTSWEEGAQADLLDDVRTEGLTQLDNISIPNALRDPLVAGLDFVKNTLSENARLKRELEHEIKAREATQATLLGVVENSTQYRPNVEEEMEEHADQLMIMSTRLEICLQHLRNLAQSSNFEGSKDHKWIHKIVAEVSEVRGLADALIVEMRTSRPLAVVTTKGSSARKHSIPSGPANPPTKKARKDTESPSRARFEKMRR